MASSQQSQQHQQENETLTFPSSHAALLAPYLPPPSSSSSPPPQSPYPRVTLTYAHSLDAAVALAPGARTALSGRESKAMTHFLRARHDAILVGAGTAVADDPGLNSRLSPSSSFRSCSSSSVGGGGDGGVMGGREAGESVCCGDGDGKSARVRQPRPVVLDPRARWAVHEGSKVIRLAAEGNGLGPFVLVGADTRVDAERVTVLEAVGGKVIRLAVAGPAGRFAWEDVLAVLKREGLESVMIEGGGEVINSLLAPPGNRFVDSVILTIAPTWLGQGGVVVSPQRTAGADGSPARPVRLTDVTWCPMGEDVVLCGTILR